MSSSFETRFAMLTNALGKAAGIPDAAPGADGVFRMEIGEKPLSVIRQGEGIVLYCALGNLPADADAANRVRAALLSANVLYRETYGACLGAAPEDRVVTLCFQTPMHSVTEEGFVRIVENFLTLAELWEKRLAELGEGEARPGEKDGKNENATAARMNDPLMRA